MYSKLITVFTPTYNRAHLIGRVYDSLKAQTFKNFEWLVIDDGSTDDTEAVICRFMKEGTMEIRYFKKENGGQHTALNRAIELAEGELLMIVDSDDYLKPNALERICYWRSTLGGAEGFAGVSGLKVYEDGRTVGVTWNREENYIDATNFDRKKYNLMGDKAETYFTDVLKAYYPIPVFEGENDVEKAVLWNRIAHAGLKLRWFNEGIYVCEYLDDGMSKNIRNVHLRNFQGFTCWKKELIDMQDNYFGVVRETSAFVNTARAKGCDIQEMARLLERNVVTILLGEAYYQLHVLKGKVLKHI